MDQVVPGLRRWVNGHMYELGDGRGWIGYGGEAGLCGYLDTV